MIKTFPLPILRPVCTVVTTVVFLCILSFSSTFGAEPKVREILGPMTSFPGSSAIVPGSLCLTDSQAQPLCLDIHGQIVGAVSLHGTGRVAVFAHTDYNRLNGLIWQHAPAFTQRLAQWLAGKSDPAKIRFLVLDDSRRLNVLRKLGFQARVFYRFEDVDWSKPDFDILLTDSWSVPEAFFPVLEQYVRNGGAIWTACTPWAARCDDFAKSFPSNRLVRPFGIVFTLNYSRQTPDNRFLLPTDEQLTQLNLQSALSTVKEALSKPYSEQDLLKPEMESVAQAINTVSDALNWVPDLVLTDELPQLKEIAAALQRPESQLSESHPVDKKWSPMMRLLIASQNRQAINNFTNPAGVPKLNPQFPGLVQNVNDEENVKDEEKTAETEEVTASPVATVTQTVEMDATVGRWASTGLYAPAGQTITITVPQSVLKSDIPLQVRIGCHSDTLWHLDSWSRYPEISLTTALTSPKIDVCSAFGGLIYIDVPDQVAGKGDLGLLEFEISGGIPAPLYVLGKTTKEQWQAMRASAAPWGEFATGKIILSVPKDVYKKVEDPESILRRWDRILDLDREFIGLGPDRARPERLVCDTQISAGFMHSGYPVMTWMSVRDGFLSEEGDYWGFYHEFGHNHQSPYWTFSAAVEVTVNWFTLYCFEKINGQPQDVPGGKMSPRRCRQLKEEHVRNGSTWESWKSDPFLGLVMFIELKQRYGWDAFKKTIRSYYDLPGQDLPQTDQQKQDRLMIQFSRAVNENLGPFFVGWGIPITQEALDQVSNLPLPKE